MTPGFKETPEPSAKKETSLVERPEFENFEDKLDHPTPEISKEQALKRGRTAFEVFIQNHQEEINKCSNFKIDKYGKTYDADDYPEICDKLAQKKKKKELIDNELSDIKEQRKNATPTTVEQKICAKKEAVFTKESEDLKEQIKELEEQIRNNKDINL